MSQEKFEINQRAGRARNVQAFQNWHEQYRQRLLNSVTAIVKDRKTAEDVTAQALASALQNLAQFRGESSLYTWVHAMALNQARQCLRPNRIVSLDSIVEGESQRWSEPDALTGRLERSECHLKLRQTLSQLPNLYRRVLVDHFVRGYSVKRIARKERLPFGTVLSRIFKGKRLLRQAWEA
jgi:RNA polymerase sigma-70 factor (ECF subfamily)